ncbi:MAG: class II aldolase/adducin family protein [Chloroflexi bacterium]|nr:MAG: class II aldolase/adducin family protein [Chloroflexota bacterium]
MDESSQRNALVQAGRRLRAAGLVLATEGNLSTRLGEDRILVSPAGRRKDELDAGDLVVVSLAEDDRETRPSGRPSSDLAIHRAIYEARGELRAIAHAHLPAALAVTLAGELPDPSSLPETALLLPRLPFVPFAPPGSERLAAAIASAFGSPDDIAGLPGAVLLERHGAVAVGETIDEAVDRLELVDLLCRVWRDARLLGRAERAAK